MTSLTRRDLLRSGLALSASTLVAGSVEPRACSAGALSGRSVGGGDWPRWLRASICCSILAGSFFRDTPAIRCATWASAWARGISPRSGEFRVRHGRNLTTRNGVALNLPHDWAVELPFVRDEDQTVTATSRWAAAIPRPASAGTGARSTFRKKTAGGASSIEFDGAFRSALVFLNGYFIGRNDNGYAPFRFDLTDFRELRRQEFSGRAHGCQLRRWLVL